MIPVRLAMRNFMCYTDVHEPLDFTGIHVACLSGDNGHGKSTLLDAMTWALWGRARARSTDELIHAGRTEMEVELEFLLDGQHYRVIRKRDSRNRGQTVLELALATGDGWRPLTGNTVGETDQQIQQLLRMSYETFTHSSFILQGKADSFTTATPAQRKQVLADILGLAYYDELEGLAREQMRARQEQASALRLRIEETERELARKPEMEAERDRCDQALNEIAAVIEQAELRLAAAQASLGQLESAEKQLQDTRQHLTALREERTQAERRTTQIRERIAKAERIVARAAEVDEGHARLVALRLEHDELNTKLSEHSRLSAEAATLEREIVSGRAELEAELKGVATRLGELEKEAGRSADLERELASTRALLQQAGELERRRRDLEERRHASSERMGGLRAQNDRLKVDMVDLRQRLDQLSGAEECPLCRADLSPERHRHITDDYQARGLTLRDQFRRNEMEVRQAESDLAAVSAELSTVQTKVDGLADAAQRHARAEAALDRARAAASELESLRPRVADLRRRLAERGYAESAHARLAPIVNELQSLGYDPARHAEVRRLLEELRPYESAQATLEQARRVLAEEQPLESGSQESLARLNATVASLEQQAELLAGQAAQVVEARARAEAADAEARARRRDRDRLADALAAARQRLEFCERQAQIRTEVEKDLEAALRQQGLFSDLALALGKNGVQAMLIDTAIPELDEHANELLARMTDGRMHLKLEMQRQKRTGGTAETLDIKIGDELGTRSYELYSGGEAFRVNFALRIALSRLLARRAGARLQTLVIDEGFGTQDVEGRDRLVDAIKAIQDDFEKILIITHIPELKDVFPVRIEVTKTPSGSVIALT